MNIKHSNQAHTYFLLIVIIVTGQGLPVSVSNGGVVEIDPNQYTFSEYWMNRTVFFASPEEVEYAVSQMQYIPDEEERAFDALEMEMNFNKPLFIKKKAAVKDVDRLFYLLENGYAGYGYFKEEGSFEEAKEKILDEVKQKLFLRSSELSKIIYDHLGFLHDCHLAIGEYDYESHLDFWYDTEFYFRKQNQKYVFTRDGILYTVISVNGKSPDSYMFPSIDSEGDSVYRIGLLSNSSPQPLELRAQGNQETQQWEIQLSNSQTEYSEIYAEKQMGGVPVIRIRSFSDHHKEYVDKFLACAEKYRDEPCLIVDIRGNGGGNTAYARQWITRYTGQQPNLIQIFTELISETSMMGRSNYFTYRLNHYPELEDQGYNLKAEAFRDIAEHIENGETDAHWSDYLVPGPKKIHSNSTLIVLMDSKVGSAAEGFLSYLQQVENVVFVGENSGGALTYGQMSYHMLPNSRLLVGLPISLNVFVDLEYREERGFYPDLWVPSEHALNYAVAAVRSGSIPTTQSYQEEIAGVEFIPESSNSLDSLDFLDIFPIILSVFYGGVLVYFNRERDSRPFFGGGFLGLLIGVYYLSRNPKLGYVFLLVGFEYLVIAFYKRRNEKSNQ